MSGTTTIWAKLVSFTSYQRLVPAVRTMSSTVEKRSQKEWNTPVNQREPRKLHLQNSLTRQKELFVPNEGRSVTWYLCGPTVYDSSHMGHARTYLSQDILRRVMTDYFGYDVEFIMNITDIDDKIIKRARQRHLLTDYLVGNAPDVEKVCRDVIDALNHFRPKWEGENDKDKKTMLDKMMTRVESSSNDLKAALDRQDNAAIENAKATLLNESRDVLSEWLDSKFGSSVTQHSVFDQLAKTYENEFFADMARLNVLPPDVVTRVSEYVPEIVDYVQKIIDNGYAYATPDGDVYFDTKSFESNPDHFYAKLVPEAYGDSETLEKNMREGEGELSITSEKLRQKRSPNDFALWKSSKQGEPFWNSPWGQGRPGWHIECSAMASAICGPKLDIHAGGFDLKFPHHDNEIAQVEAHYDDPHWVNYFLHCGTLRIQGMKMSKSLKNFITIRQALRDYSARQLRLLFLMHNWADVLDYSTSTMERAVQFEKITHEFFQLVKHHLRQHYVPDNSKGFVKDGKADLELRRNFKKVKEEIHNALCDSVDTRTVVEKVRELVGLGNVYIQDKEKQKEVPNCNLVRKIAQYITNLFRIFGVVPPSQEIGYPLEDSAGGNGVSTEDIVMPYLNATAAFRDAIRTIAKDEKAHKILQECDRFRDEVMPELGVRLEDRGGPTCVKLEDRETLLRERAQKQAAEAAKQAERERKAAEKAEKEAAKRIPPSEMFRRGEHLDSFSQWDENGIPTHTKEGEEVTKSQRKKLEKLWQTQKKGYDAIMAAAQ